MNYGAQLYAAEFHDELRVSKQWNGWPDSSLQAKGTLYPPHQAPCFGLSTFKWRMFVEKKDVYHDNSIIKCIFWNVGMRPAALQKHRVIYMPNYDKAKVSSRLVTNSAAIKFLTDTPHLRL